jgi:hypothetical protein
MLPVMCATYLFFHKYMLFIANTATKCDMRVLLWVKRLKIFQKFKEIRAFSFIREIKER